MSTHIYEREGNILNIRFEFPSKEYEKAQDDFFEKMKGQMKGQVKRADFEKVVGRAAFIKPVINQLIQSAYQKASKEYPEEIYYSPEISIIQEGKGKNLILNAKVQISPEVSLGDYSQIEITSEEIKKIKEDAEIAPEENRADTVRYFMQNTYIEKITDLCCVEIPDTMAEERAWKMLSAFDHQLANNGLDITKYYEENNTNEKELLASFVLDARKQLKTRMALLEFAKRENLQATEEAYRQEVKRLSELYMLPEERLHELLKQKEGAKIREDIAIANAAEYVGKIIDEKYLK